MSRKGMFLSSDKALGELGYTWRTPIEALRDAITWLQEQGSLAR